jgi:hypothetical protein
MAGDCDIFTAFQNQAYTRVHILYWGLYNEFDEELTSVETKSLILIIVRKAF